MDTEDSGSMGFQHRGGGGGGGDGSESIFKTSNSVDPYYSSGWDQLVSLNHSGNFGGASVGSHNAFVNSQYSIVLESQAAINGSSHMVQYPSDSGLVDMVPKIPSFGSGSFSEMVSSFGLPECGQMAETISHPTTFSQSKKGGNEKTLTSANSQENCQIAEDGAADSSPNGKRKRRVSGSHSPLNPNKNVEGGMQIVSSRESLECSKEEDEKKEKFEHYNVANSRNKQAGKQANDSNSGEPPKDNYIHMRAKRGQATNSHSLAERVRRERISERMRLLQELVPGCNKITGKAMMLDEIINYVQSLQQQVEFLSMKLSTVNPEVNVDIERILSKDILHSRGANAASLAVAPGLSTSHPFHGIPQGNFAGIPNISPPFHPLPQNVWDNEFQSVLQMGFDSNPSANNLGPNGR